MMLQPPRAGEKLVLERAPCVFRVLHFIVPNRRASRLGRTVRDFAPMLESKSLVTDEIFIEPRWLPPDRIKNCVVLADRETMLRTLPQGGIVAEVGTLHGAFAKKIWEIVNPDEFHIFDESLDTFDRRHFNRAIDSGRVVLHEGDSAPELAKILTTHAGRFDWIYIDGDHSYGGVQKDIQQAKQLIKPDGLLIFDDYTVYSPLERMQYGVMRAVNDLILDDGFEMVAFALSTLDYHNVVVRRITDRSSSR